MTSSLPSFGVVTGSTSFGVVTGSSTVTLADGTVIPTVDVDLNMGSTAEAEDRANARFGAAVRIVGEELAAGRAVMRLGTEQPVMVFGDPYTLRCFPREGDDAKGLVDALQPGEVLVPRHGDDVENWQILHALRRGYPVKLEGPYCRWCAGDGIDHRHSNRVRALLLRESTHDVPHGYGPGRRVQSRSRIQVVPGVAKGRPLNDWLREMEEKAFAVDELLRSIGRTEAELRCRRCMGTGR